MAVRKRRGRPTVGVRVPLGLRVTPEMKTQLDAAAGKSGRSQSQEAEFRLERSFDREGLLAEVLTLAFGSRLTAGFVWMLALVMDTAGKVAQEEATRRKALMHPDAHHWMQEPVAAYQAGEAARWLLRSFQGRDPLLRGKAAAIRSPITITGSEVARQMIQRAFGRNQKEADNSLTEFKDTVAELRKVLGPKIAKRFSGEDLPEAEEAPQVTIERTEEAPQPRSMRSDHLSAQSEAVARAIFELLMSKPKTPSKGEIAAAVEKALKS